jgi:hypothetical protein
MLAEGVQAEAKLRAEHLRLFSKYDTQRAQASAYNVTAKNWAAPFESVDDNERGKQGRGVQRPN